MCRICDGQSEDDYLDDQRRLVDSHGWTIQYVESSLPSGRGPWAYTIGLTALCGQPELLVAGLEPEPSAYLLGSIASCVAQGGAIGHTHHLYDGEPLLFPPVHRSHFDHSDRFDGWKRYYQRFGPAPQWSAHQLIAPASLVPPDMPIPNLLAPADPCTTRTTRRGPHGRHEVRR